MTEPLTPPAPDDECPREVAPAVIDPIRDALLDAHADALGDEDTLAIHARTGPRCGWLRARVGPPRHPHEFELFTRDVDGDGLDGALGVLVDYIDGVLTEYFDGGREAGLGLGFHPRDYDGVVVWGRSEVRDLDAEAEADRWLNGVGEA